jgi:hypothetical protein
MRRDMSKVLVERPRHQGGRLRNRPKVRDNDLLPPQLGVRKDARLRGGMKSLNENLRPLERFLASCVGRPWDKVWAEVSANLNPRNAVHKHVRDHIPDFVAQKTRFKNGEVWVHHERGGPKPLKESHERLYVDPRTRLLMRNKYWKSWSSKGRARRAAEAKALGKRMRVLSPTLQLHLLDDGAWWEVALAPVPTVVEETRHRHFIRRREVELEVADAVLDAHLSKLDRAELYGRAGVHAVRKRQLSKKDMRKWKLR